MQEFLRARGLCFRAVQWGQRPHPMLLLHGVHGTAESWEGLIQALNGALPAIAIEIGRASCRERV